MPDPTEKENQVVPATHLRRPSLDFAGPIQQSLGRVELGGQVMSASTVAVGFVGLGDQGGPLATAIAEAGYDLHVWARRQASLEAVASVPHTVHLDLPSLGAACDVVGLCVGTDEDVHGLLDGGLVDGLRPGSVVVNHGTGLPSSARRFTERAARNDVEMLDAPVSGARLKALAKALTTMVGGRQEIAERCRPIFETFSAHVLHMGDAGMGQTAKLLNNALLILNQKNIEDVVGLAGQMGLDVPALLGLFKVGSGSSVALGHLNTLITPETVGHLSAVEELDMKIFDEAMAEAGIDGSDVTARGIAGARGLRELIAASDPGSGR